MGTTKEEGYGVSSGRPVVTTKEDGYGVSSGRLPDYKVGKHIEFRGIDLPDKWDISEDKINLTPDISESCAQRVMQQRCFDKKPLAKALCCSVEESSGQLSMEHTHSLSNHHMECHVSKHQPWHTFEPLMPIA